MSREPVWPSMRRAARLAADRVGNRSLPHGSGHRLTEYSPASRLVLVVWALRILGVRMVHLLRR